MKRFAVVFLLAFGGWMFWLAIVPKYEAQVVVEIRDVYIPNFEGELSPANQLRMLRETAAQISADTHFVAHSIPFELPKSFEDFFQRIKKMFSAPSQFHSRGKLFEIKVRGSSSAAVIAAANAIALRYRDRAIDVSFAEKNRELKNAIKECDLLQEPERSKRVKYLRYDMSEPIPPFKIWQKASEATRVRLSPWPHEWAIIVSSACVLSVLFGFRSRIISRQISRNLQWQQHA